MVRRFLFCCWVIFLAGAVACDRAGEESGGRVVEAYLPNSSSVAFDIAPLPGEPGSSRWMATYTSQGKTAKFKIEFTRAKDSTDHSFQFGHGRFVAQAGSDASVLLVDLKKALEARTLPARVQRTGTLPFTFVIIGENLSQAPNGGFNEKPSGNWRAVKIFLGKGEEEAQVFVNINPAIRKGQFSIKDAEYGDRVLARLAKVL